MHSPGEKNLVLIVESDDDKHFRWSRLLIQHLTKHKLFRLEICRITCRGGIPHVSKLAIFLVGESIEEAGRHGTIKHQVSLEQVDSFKCLESSWLSWGWFATTDIGAFLVWTTDIGTISVVVDVWIREVGWSLRIIVVDPVC
jgi:hypothetical protein